MKKLPAVIVALMILISSVCGTLSANAQTDTVGQDKNEIYTSSDTSNQGTVRMKGSKGDEITVFFNMQKTERASGFLAEFSFNRSYLTYNDYEQYYDATFVNRINDKKMMFSVLFDPNGTTVSDETEIIAFKFTANQDITNDDVCATYVIKEFYNTDMFELDYDSVVVKAVNAKDDQGDGPHIHSMVVHDAKSPTCTEPGWGQWAECKDCGEILIPKIEVPATGHKEVKDPAVEATCTHEGKTEGSHCETCGTVIKAQQVIPKKEHNYVNGVCTMCGKKKDGGSTDTHSDTDTQGGGGDTEEHIIGDISCDGKVTSKDSLIMLRVSINIITLNDLQKKLGDVNNDGKVNNTDSMLVQRYSIGLKAKNNRIGEKYTG